MPIISTRWHRSLTVAARVLARAATVRERCPLRAKTFPSFFHAPGSERFRRDHIRDNFGPRPLASQGRQVGVYKLRSELTVRSFAPDCYAAFTAPGRKSLHAQKPSSGKAPTVARQGRVP